MRLCHLTKWLIFAFNFLYSHKIAKFGGLFIRTKAYIPIEFYPSAGNKDDINTFAVKATFCTSAKVPDDIVYAITKEIFDNLEDFKRLHPGAMKYYREVGLMR